MFYLCYYQRKKGMAKSETEIRLLLKTNIKRRLKVIWEIVYLPAAKLFDKKCFFLSVIGQLHLQSDLEWHWHPVQNCCLLFLYAGLKSVRRIPVKIKHTNILNLRKHY